MRKTLTVLVVGALVLTMFAGSAAASPWVLKYRAWAAFRGWQGPNFVAGYEYWFNYNWNEQAMWRETHPGSGVIAVPYHYNWHMQYTIKTLDPVTGKTMSMTHYQFHHHVQRVGSWPQGQQHFKQSWLWKYHFVGGPVVVIFVNAPPLPPFADPFLPPPGGSIRIPTVEDSADLSTMLMDMLFASGMDITMLPNLESIEMWDDTGNGYIFTTA